MRLAARRVGRTPRVFARLIAEAGVVSTPPTLEGAVLVLTEAQQAHIEQGVLSLAAEIENENTLTF